MFDLGVDPEVPWQLTCELFGVNCEAVMVSIFDLREETEESILCFEIHVWIHLWNKMIIKVVLEKERLCERLTQQVP